MSLIGSLEDWSLADILQLLDTGNKTGLLRVCAEPVSKSTLLSVYYIWVYQGRLVAVANRLDGQGLVGLINQQQWVSSRVITKLAQLCPNDKPFGLHLKNQGVLRTSQLKQLFFLQVLQPVNTLFPLKNGQFKFDQNVSLPLREMTGLSVSSESLMVFPTPKDTTYLCVNRWKSNFATGSLTVYPAYLERLKKTSKTKGIQENKLSLELA